MLVQLLGSFAEFEGASLLDRIGAGMERKASRGERTGGTPPYGYRKPRGRRSSGRIQPLCQGPRTARRRYYGS